jgi:hypothetical protein
MHVNELRENRWYGNWWIHRWENGDSEKVPQYVDKFRAWRPLQQRPRDGTTVRNRTGGPRRIGLSSER